MLLATQNAPSLPPTHLAASSLERQVGREIVTRVAAVHAPHFFTAPTHAPTMHLATQNAPSLPPTHLAANSLERQLGREVVASASNRLGAG